MTSQCAAGKPPRRHDLVFLSPKGWRAVFAARRDLAADPLVALWDKRGWPLIGRRALPGDMQGVALGLPLPPFAGKRRLSLLVQRQDVIATAPPPGLRSASLAAPRAWRPTLDRLQELVSQHSLDARVFGSLAWRALTGLDYLNERSDLDLLLYVRRDSDLYRLAIALADIEAAAPMRLDGEFIRDDGAAVNWREFNSGARKILVKTIGGVALLNTTRFLLEELPS
jgi:phosphoribosyl-dephospho-CoA transferase